MPCRAAKTRSAAREHVSAKALKTLPKGRIVTDLTADAMTIPADAGSGGSGLCR
jgi:hypothetical protein